jgi:hypothetical protein
MNISQFNSLSLQEKRSYIFNEKAVRLISFRYCTNEKSTLFDCGSFFAEIFFRSQERKITRIHGIRLEDDVIDVYIDQMINYRKRRYH